MSEGEASVLTELTEIVNFVYDQLGPTHLESIYMGALGRELEANGFELERQSPIPVWFTTSLGKRHHITTLYADFVVRRYRQTYLLETKAINPTAANIEATQRQVNAYVRFSDEVYNGCYGLFFPKSIDKEASVVSMFSIEEYDTIEVCADVSYRGKTESNYSAALD
jgi:GxxExxY protein